jgi:ATP-dependent Clp protease ATP-binding subunit ClpC
MFSEPARRVLSLAHEEARLLLHNYLGTEHLLLGILREHDNAGARALATLGLSLDNARGEVEAIIGRGPIAPTGDIPATPRFKNVLEASLSETQALGASHVGPEHLLLSLVDEGRGVGAEVLIARGLDLSVVAQQVLGVIQE